jgi:S-DNA-T family DNA segregation ATPase FtsK/SpoIIIE
VRIGPDEPFAVQVGHAGAPAVTGVRPPVVVIEDGAPAIAAMRKDGPTALGQFVATAQQAAALAAAPALWRPWLPPLPTELALDQLPPGAVALVDDPDAQEQRPVTWGRRDGNLLCFGARGTTTASVLLALALAAVRTADPAGLHLYGVDLGTGALAPLANLPHCGGVATAAEPDRLARLVRRLHAHVEAVAAGRGTPEEIVVVVDGLPAWRHAFDCPGGFELLDALDRVLIDGPGAGVHVAATVDRPGALPPSITTGVRQRWVFALPDPADARSLGVPATDRLGPGRAIDAATGLEMQVATAASVENVGTPLPRDPAWAAPIGMLPDVIDAATLPVADTSRRPWSVPVGWRDDDLDIAALTLHAADHVLVSGRSRTGRSTALVLVTERLRAACAHLVVATVTPRPSPLRCTPADLRITDRSVLPTLTDFARRRAPLVIVVDDAELVDDDGTLAAILGLGRDDLHVVAAGRPDVLRSTYGHWTAAVRRSRLGVLLQPDPDIDGDLLGTTLPRRRAVAPRPGRGYLVVDGQPEMVQLARPAIMNQ